MRPIKTKQRPNYSAEFKARVALEAIKERRTLQGIASNYSVHPNQVTTWKRQVTEALLQIFIDHRLRGNESEEALKSSLHEKVGKLQVQSDLLKKVGAVGPERKRSWIKPHLSVIEHCALAGVSRSGLYYVHREKTEENFEFMRLTDEQYTRTPFYGVRKMRWWLVKKEYKFNIKRVRRLLHQMGLEAIYAMPHSSTPAPGPRMYPYRLRRLSIACPNQVWGADIAYIRMQHGFVYLAAIMDWFSRYAISWELSVTLDINFCPEIVTRSFRAEPDATWQVIQAILSPVSPHHRLALNCIRDYSLCA
ncbi:MAG: transposase [Acidobacteria bacterium]|nr:transposase [Acidobacteriota bacterium]